MRPVTLPGIEEYAERHTTPDPEVLLRVAAATRRSCPDHQMMVGTVEGRLLQMLVFAVKPQIVLEIGTFTGYSALAMAQMLPPGGRIITCEIDEQRAQVARRHFDSSPFADRITIAVGPALETLSRLDGPFDFVFIDADKTSYVDYLEAVLVKMSEDGLIAVDNTLWNGDVIRSGRRSKTDKETAALHRFNCAVAKDPRLVCVLLTVRDGVTVIRRAKARDIR